ncbi:hypothetical protein GW17_00003106 [Ensete ventricosum]|nr:hypothetical protein GW17_00003106 [Ensete ventricosum]
MDFPSYSTSKEQARIYNEWFSFADSDGDGRITGNDAIKFFSMSNLSRPDLKQIWAIADSKRQGFLGFGEFVTALQLVALAQAGNEITQDTLANADLEKLNPPVMEGLDTLLSRNKASTKKIDPEIDVNSKQQSPPSTLQWFSSKSAKKVLLAAISFC